MIGESGHFVADAGDIAAALEAMRRRDAVSLPVLGEDYRRRLLEAARRCAYRPARAVVGGGDRIVRQAMEVCVDFRPGDAFCDLAHRFQALVDAAASPAGTDFFETPLGLDDLVLQRYRSGRLGISPHRDGLRYVNLACLFTLAGGARFCLCEDRRGAGAREIDAAPGTVILMRAPGFLGGADRPFHFVSDIRGRRYSFGLRQRRTA